LSLASPGVLARDSRAIRRSIRCIVPGPAGGAGDVLARLVMDHLAARGGIQVMVENRPGAGTNIGMAAVARAEPDGATLGLANLASHATNRWLYRQLPFDPVLDFEPISLLAVTPNLMVVPPSLGVATVAEFVAHARAHPDEVHYGSVGAGSSQHLVGAQFAQASGVALRHVPYAGLAALLNVDLMAGRLQVLFQSISAVAPLVREGRLRPLAVTGTTRSAAFPEVPTLRESGLDIVSTGWFGLVAPARTPEPILDRLHDELTDVLAEPALAERIADTGSIASPSPSRRHFAHFMAEEAARWRPVIQALGLSVG
jgi:tripartite-type tricarboxylate transporter receptor subunit TctC